MPGERRSRQGKSRVTPLDGRPTGRGKKKAPSGETAVEVKGPAPTEQEKAAYRSEVEQRLDKLGWTKQSMDFPEWSSLKSEWLAVVEPNELKDLNDDKVWENIKRHLDSLRNRLKAERGERKELRFDRLRRLLSLLKQQNPPLVAFKARRLGKPPCTEYPCPPFDYTELKSISQKIASPEIADVHKWPVIRSMLEAETTADELEQAFIARRSEIDAMVVEWRDKFHARLLSFLPEIEGEILRPTLVADNSDPFKNLSDDMKRLLRADSLFSVYDWNEGPHIINSSRNRVYTYKDLFQISSGGAYKPDDLIMQIQLPMDRIGKYTQAQEVARELLKDIGRPDASYLELECDLEGCDFGESTGVEGEWICGRCIDKEPKTWQEIVEHYVDERENYRLSRTELAKKRIVYHDLHSSAPSNRPMIRYYSAQVAREMWSYSAGERDVQQCQICSRYPMKHDVQGPKKLMFKHLSEVHGINQPKFLTHYSTPMTIFPY
ncbi:hypothetical protein FRC11_009548 [Ceratobasidium sp. 423]|nr:hypothetical protein FRC11_009548 [Ceratobasidium sp. 423]